MRSEALARRIAQLFLAAGVLAVCMSTSPAFAEKTSSDSQVRVQSTVRASGLPWSSGVAPVGISGVSAERFGRKRGAAVDNIVVFPGRQSWSTLMSTFWYQALPASFDPVRDDAVVSVPLWPATNSLQDTGTDDQWRQLGLVISDADPNAFVRLGWEMDLKATYWRLDRRNMNGWVQQFRRAASLMKATCPSCRIVWNPNHGQTQLATRPAFKKVQAIVDVYAIDDYDIYPPIKDKASRRAHMNKPGNLNEAYQFARRHGKAFAVPEWGVACVGPGCQWRGSAGGDNPLYVRTMTRWFESHAHHLAFEAYFDEPSRHIRSSLYTDPIGHRAGRALRQELTRIRDAGQARG